MSTIQIESFYKNINNSYRVLINIHEKLIENKFKIPGLLTTGIIHILPGYIKSYDTHEKKEIIMKDFIDSSHKKWNLFEKRNDDLIMEFIPLITKLCPVAIPKDLIADAFKVKDKDNKLIIGEGERVLIWKIIHRQIELAKEYARINDIKI